MRSRKKSNLEIFLRLKSASLESLNNSNLSEDKKNRLANIFAIKNTTEKWRSQWELE